MYGRNNSNIWDQIGNLNMWIGKYNTIVSFGHFSRKNGTPLGSIKIHFAWDRKRWEDRETERERNTETEKQRQMEKEEKQRQSCPKEHDHN